MKYIVSVGIVSLIFLIISQLQFVFYKNDIINLIISLTIFLRFFRIKNNKKSKTIIIQKI